MEKEKKIQLAKSALSRYCAYQERTKRDILTRLKKFNLSAEQENHVVVYLENEGFFDEKRFAISYVLGKFNQNKWGKIKIKHGLNIKFIQEHIITEALESIPEELYERTLQNLIKKKLSLIKDANDLLKRKKIIDFLLRKGFEYERIRKSMESIG